METKAVPSYRDLKRCWMRRKYRRLRIEAAGNKRQLKVERLGGGGPRRLWKIRKTSRWYNLQVKRVFSPLKFLASFHDAYVKAMIRWANSMRKDNKGRHVSMASGEKVDVKLVVEMYKRVVASGVF